MKEFLWRSFIGNENSKRKKARTFEDNRWGDVEVLSMKKNGSGLKMRMIKCRTDGGKLGTDKNRHCLL